MIDLPGFNIINEALEALVNRQNDPHGCQVVYMPNPDGGSMYIMQIALRGKIQRRRETRQFLRDAARLVRNGGRHIVFRCYRCEANIEYDTREVVTAGAIRLYAGWLVGGIERMDHEGVEMIVRPN